MDSSSLLVFPVILLEMSFHIGITKLKYQSYTFLQRPTAFILRAKPTVVFKVLPGARSEKINK
jgi:hypothetical protein